MFKTLLGNAGSSLLLLVYLGVMPTICGGLFASYALTHQEWLRSMTLAEIGAINLLFSFILALGWMPTTFFSLLGGYLWGWKCLPFVLISYTFASLVGYYTCKEIDKGKLEHALSQRFPLQKIFSKLQKSGFWLTVFCRLSPALPFAVMNAIFAMVQYPTTTFLIGGLVGMLPRTIFALFLGQRFSKITHISELKTDYTIWITLLFVIVSFIGIGWIGKKHLK